MLGLEAVKPRKEKELKNNITFVKRTSFFMLSKKSLPYGGAFLFIFVKTLI